jgi:hypothetical protein
MEIPICGLPWSCLGRAVIGCQAGKVEHVCGRAEAVQQSASSVWLFCLMAGSVAVSELAFTMMFYFSRIGLHTKNGAYSSLPSLAGASAQYCGLPTSVRRPVSTPLHQHCAPPPQLPQHRRVLLSDHWHCTWFVVQLCARRGWVCLRRHSRLEDVYISLCGSQIRSLL